jgi:hypothetical protein
VQNDNAQLWALMNRAFESGGSTPEALQKLVDLKLRIDERAAAREFAVRFAEFQRRCPQIPRNTIKTIATESGAKFPIRYADEEQLVASTRPLLSELGFTVTYDYETNETGTMLTVIGTLHHEGGHSTTCRAQVPVSSPSPKAAAWFKTSGTATFGRRLVYVSLLGLTQTEPEMPDEDQSPITPEQVSALREALIASRSDELAFLRWLGADRLENIPRASYERAASALAQKMRKAKR